MLAGIQRNLAKHCKATLLILLVMGLAACGGGGGSSGSTGGGGGSPSAPRDITGSMHYATSVGSGDSYYVVSGLTTGQLYAIYAYGVTGDIALYGYADSGFVLALCSSDRAGTADEACSTAPNSEGKIFIRVNGAKSGGGASFTLTVMPATLTQGTAAAPLDITPSLPFQGTTLNLGSYYVVTGLTPGQRYTVALGNVIYNPELNVYQHKAFDYAVCTSTNAAWTNEACDAAANFEGKLYIKVNANNGMTLSQIGAYYAITVTPASGTDLIFEGYSDAPIDVTGRLPYAGQVNLRDSYYTITGLTPGTRYEIRMNNPSADVQLWVFPGGQFYNSLCTAGYYFSLPARKSCVAQAPASGTLNIQVPFVASAATYTLDVVLAPVAEGSVASPKPITVPYNGQVDNTASYYVISGLTPGWNYQVVLSNASDNNLTVSTGDSTSTLGGSIGCTDLAGNLYIKVDGSYTSNGNGAWFTLGLAAANNPEGTSTSPVNITTSSPSSPHAGQVDNRSSYYTITGLPAGTYYMAHISDNTDSVLVGVYDNSSYTGPSLCSMMYANHCLAPVPAGGVLYIQVAGPSYIGGTKFKFWLEPSLLTSEGVVTPVTLTLNTPYAGKVSSYSTDNRSRYSISGLSGNTPYKIALSNTTDDVSLTVYSDSNYTTELCRSYRQGLYDENCVATPPGAGSGKTLYIAVVASAYSVPNYDGTNYTVTVTSGATAPVNEGAAGAPVIITPPYNGQVRATVSTTQSSYYKVTGLDPTTRYAVVLKNLSDAVGAYVYPDATFSGSVLCAAIPYAPVNKHCAAQPNTSGELFIKVDGSYQADATFTVDVVAAPAAMGAMGAPTDITAQTLPYAGQVDGTKSYYMKGGLTPSTSYQVMLRNLTESGRVALYSDNTFTTHVATGYGNSFDVASVVGTTDSSGALYFLVDGATYTSGNGAFFDMDVGAAPQSEGSIASPVTVALTPPFSYAGQKAFLSATHSYYKISGLTPFSSHRVTLRKRTANAWIKIYGRADFTHELCYSGYGDYRTGCAAAANHAGEMFIEVGDMGGFYDIYVP